MAVANILVVSIVLVRCLFQLNVPLRPKMIETNLYDFFCVILIEVIPHKSLRYLLVPA